MVRSVFTNHLFQTITDLTCAATVFKADPLDPARGKLYRDKVLSLGGSRDEIDILKVRLLQVTFYIDIDLNIK